jgi:hypothetical protein
MKGNYPINMDALLAQPIVEDVNNDGELEIIAYDINSNLVCFSFQGDEIWEARIGGYPNQVCLNFRQ